MATRRNGYTKSARREIYDANAYMYGNTVRKAVSRPVREEQREYKRRPVHKVHRNKAIHMSPAYVMFIVIVAVAALLLSIWYLQMRTELTGHSENVAALQQELADMKEENTSRYNSIVDSVNLQDVKNVAMGEMGMKYADSSQIITYHNPVNDFVKQLEDIPKSGILPQSDVTKK